MSYMVGRKPYDPCACNKDTLLERRYRCKIVGLEENTSKLKNNHFNLQTCRLWRRPVGIYLFCEGRKRRVEILGAELPAREDWVIWCVLVSNNSYVNMDEWNTVAKGKQDWKITWIATNYLSDCINHSEITQIKMYKRDRRSFIYLFLFIAPW